jgi:hypothetical protein
MPHHIEPAVGAAQPRTKTMFFLETALLAVYFNPNQYLPGFVAATVVLGTLLEPYYRQVAATRR